MCAVYILTFWKFIKINEHYIFLNSEDYGMDLKCNMYLARNQLTMMLMQTAHVISSSCSYTYRVIPLVSIKTYAQQTHIGWHFIEPTHFSSDLIHIQGETTSRVITQQTCLNLQRSKTSADDDDNDCPISQVQGLLCGVVIWLMVSRRCSINGNTHLTSLCIVYPKMHFFD